MSSTLKKILIVDDVAVNRLILREMLHKEYSIIEASNGAAALEILSDSHMAISAILLDISMPGLDGYEVLRRIRSTPSLASLPVIMMTGNEDESSRITALGLGANDFVIKPYSSEIIKHCLSNNIALSEASATVSAMKRDRLTGLYNREAFFTRVHEAVSEHEAGYYILACFDIDNFKVINDQYGTIKGDEVLRHIATAFSEGFKPFGGICCRIFADYFSVLYPASYAESDELAAIRNYASGIDWLVSPIAFSIGRYVVDDVTLPPSAMCDRAMLAAATVKGHYGSRIALYSEEMRDRLIRDQEIVAEMEAALSARQFEAWFQPQYNHSTVAMIGAEALVRWRHPVKGLIPPYKFIPIFEQNGFIYSLDKYVWEEVCAHLRRWQDEGYSPLPVSVNISRYDVLQPDIVEVITGLIEKYEIPIEMLRLEITESAFSGSGNRIIEVVKQLIDRGFTVEIDDFGSGYSSLNTLKDVPAQILKLDMRFLESSNSERGGNIVESVVRMAKWLGISVIAEGVETVEQADYLCSIGCNYIQGYLYAKPMPVDEYEKHCKGLTKEEHLLKLESVNNLDNNSFWDPNSMDTLIFNSYVGGACIFEYFNGKIELLRVTDKYLQVICGDEITVEDALKLQWSDHLDEESIHRVFADLDESVKTKNEITGEYTFLDLPHCPHETHLRSTMRVISASGERYLVYCTNENITEQRKAERRERDVAERMKSVMDSVTSGICATVLDGHKIRYLFVNDCYYNIHGYTKEQFENEVDNVFDSLHPDDRQTVIERIKKLVSPGETDTLEYRLIRRDGKEAWVKTVITTRRFDGVDNLVQVSIVTDITEQVIQNSHIKLVNDSIPGGVATYTYKDGTIGLSYCNDGFCELFGGSREGLEKRGSFDPLDWVFEDDKTELREQIDSLVHNGIPINCIFRIHLIGGGFKWINERASVAEKRNGVIQFNSILLDITEQQSAVERLRISEEENNLAVVLSGTIICRFTVEDRIMTLSPEAAERLSLPESINNVPYEPVKLGMISPSSTDAYIGFFESIVNGIKASSAIFQQKYLNDWRWLEAKSTTIFSDSGKPIKAVISFDDVTERLEKETIYKKWVQSLDDRTPDSYTLFRCNLNSDSSYDTREGTLIHFDFDSAGSSFNERTTAYVRKCICEEDKDRFIASVNSDVLLAGYYRGKRSDSFEFRELTQDGKYRWLRLAIDLVEYPNSTEVGAYLMYENIDKAKRAELQTKELSETDRLTGILNRTAFISRIDRILASSNPETRSALLMLDIDGFKRVNDVFGHAAGDQTLIDIAHNLSSVTRHNDLVARLGGDEFVVFMNNILDTSSAVTKAKQICSVTRKSLSMEVHISTSIGIALAPHDGTDFETLYKKADAALYHIKGSGKDNYLVYNENMADEHLEPEADTIGPDGIGIGEKRRRMLIVDDNNIDHELMRNIFKNEFILEKAKDGNSALIRLRHYGGAISVVLLDLMMPGMNGFEVLEKMQENEELRDIPVIIVSGDESRESCLSAIRKGATDFITKPVDADLLRIRVQSAVSKAENKRLKALNSVLEAQNDERVRYESALESTGITFIEYNRLTDEFLYRPSISRYIHGSYDKRKLWQILLSDKVTDAKTVKVMQDLLKSISDNISESETNTIVKLRTPNNSVHSFRVNIRRPAEEYRLADRLILTLNDLDYEPNK